MPDFDKPTVLILGGTAEAADLARALVDGYADRLNTITSLAGRTRSPSEVSGRVRSGGFGGANALAEFLIEQKIGAVVDATHPFAEQISANAVTACANAQVPRLVLARPSWVPKADDDWTYFDTVAAAARALPGLGQRVFLTIGVQELAPFFELANLWFLVRLIELPIDPLPLTNAEIITGRGPFSVDSERALMESHAIEVLVTKASGGAATEAKLAAARQLGLPVAMIRRPPAPSGPSIEDLDTAIGWIVARLGS